MLQPEDYADVPINTEDHANVLLRFDNGNRGSVTVSQVSAGRKNQLKLEISGSNKTFAFNSQHVIVQFEPSLDMLNNYNRMFE
jgi:predicted dehydrogenase